MDVSKAKKETPKNSLYFKCNIDCHLLYRILKDVLRAIIIHKILAVKNCLRIFLDYSNLGLEASIIIKAAESRITFFGQHTISPFGIVCFNPCRRGRLDATAFHIAIEILACCDKRIQSSHCYIQISARSAKPNMRPTK